METEYSIPEFVKEVAFKSHYVVWKHLSPVL